MKVTTTDRWNLTKRFLKHSEALLQEKIQREEELILLFLQAINEVFLQNQMIYLQKGLPLCLQQARLVSPKSFNEKQLLDTSIKLSILKLENGGIEHSIFLPDEELKGNRARYFELICHVYTSVLREFMVSKTPSQDKENSNRELWPDRAENSRTGKYRQQKSVILNLEQYTRQKQKRGRPIGSGEPGEVSEWEQEITEHQNSLLKDLESGRERIHELELVNQRVVEFYRKLLNDVEVTNNDLIATVDKVTIGKEVKQEQLQLLKDIFKDKTIAHKNFLDLLLLIENRGRYPNLRRVEEINCLEWVHKGIADFCEGNDGKEISFELHPELLGRYSIIGDPGDLNHLLKVFLSLLYQVNEIYGKKSKPLIRIEAIQRRKQVEIVLQIKELRLPENWRSHFSQFTSIFETAKAESFRLAVNHFFINAMIANNGGKLSVMSEKKRMLRWVVSFKRGGV